jgi:hypothetical protein
LLEKGAKPDILDSKGHKPIDLVGAGGTGAPGQQVAAAAASSQATATIPVAGRSGGGANTASAAELRALLQNAASKK